MAKRYRVLGPRLLGLVLLVILLWRVDLQEIWQAWSTANKALIGLAVVLHLPMIGLKTLRWQIILRAQGTAYDGWNAYLSTWGSIFIGFLTPGRLGEFVKAAHVMRDCGTSSARAFSSVLSDRLFDLYVLMLVGTAGLLTLGASTAQLLALVLSAALLTVPFALFLHDTSFNWIKRIGSRFGRPGRRLFADQGWLIDMRQGFLQLTRTAILEAVILTALAYLIFFAQCYLLARALDISADFLPVTYAVALGSLVTLIPVSISGLGTREATITAYLATVDVSNADALSFSLLVFATFYLGGGLIGAAAWWLKPVDLNGIRQNQAKTSG